jgi:hypothetical protein
MTLKLISITFLIALTVASVSAQQKPDFSGTWKLNVDKSDFGMLGGPTSRTDVITHKDPALSYTFTAEGPQGKQEGKLTYTTDGKEVVNKMGEREMKSTVKWAGSSLVISSKFVFNGTDATGEGNWSLSPDGKTLTINQHYASSLGEADQKIVFDKQEAAAPATPPAKTKP